MHDNIFPECADPLRNRRADVLVKHEAPSCHRHGFVGIDLAAAHCRACLVVHGHHHESYEGVLPSGTPVRGLAKAEVFRLRGGGLFVIYFVDFEASSLLPSSFPIEVAWVDTNGQGESYLIRPLEEWLDDGGWSYESEAVHGISVDTLMRDGIPVERVAKRAADALLPQQVMACSDAPGFDGGWMETLLDAGGQRKSSGFRGRTVRLLDVRQLYGCKRLVMAALLAWG
jgi:hypothetical protein